jgi:hypothetical protein
MVLSRFHVGGDQRCQHNAGEDDLEGYGGVHHGLSNMVVARIGLWCVGFIRFVPVCVNFLFQFEHCSLGSFLRCIGIRFGRNSYMCVSCVLTGNENVGALNKIGHVQTLRLRILYSNGSPRICGRLNTETRRATTASFLTE